MSLPIGQVKGAILYLSYDGMLEPLGQSQVLAYLEKLAREWQVHLVSFEKKADRLDRPRMEGMRSRLSAAGIAWTPLAYHKTPSVPATAFDICVGTVVAVWIAVRHKVTIVHARSYVPALIALIVTRAVGARFLFDMRGFWADERVDGDLWPRAGRLYRAAKSMERRFMLAADHVVTLTQASARELAGFDYLKGRMPPVTVIPTCADLDRFWPQESVGNRPFTLGYVGSLGTWYLFDEVLRFFKAIRRRRPNARLLVVNRNEHGLIRASISRAAIDLDCCEIVATEHQGVAALIGRMDAGTAFIKPAYSKLASAPTKLAEYLGCGVPCVGNINVGDMEEVLAGERVGVVLKDFSDDDHAAAVDRLLHLLDEPGIRMRCVDVARKLFALGRGVDAYRSIYEQLAATAVRSSVDRDR